jgi:hypothetical protein
MLVVGMLFIHDTNGIEWLSTEGYEVFGDICEMGEIGMKIDIRCLGHLIGLKMAFERLKKEKRE